MNREIEVILNSTHDAMILVNKEGYITLFNKSAVKLTKIKYEDAIGKKVEDVIESTRLPIILKTGNSELNKYQSLGEIAIITNRMPIRNEGGEIIGAIAIFRDITEIKELAEEITDLKNIRAMLEAIFNATSDAMSVVDGEGKGILINPAYTRLTGYNSKDVIGKVCTVDLAEGESAHLKVLREKKIIKSVRLKVGPNKKDVIVDAAPIMVNEELIGSVAVIHDLTEINKLIHELDKAKKIIRNLEAKYTFDDIIGDDGEMINVIEKAKLAAVTPATVILRGESGTGKELFAHAIHNASNRKNAQFVRVNCSALNPTLLESELFGYEEGAFTGAIKGGRIGLFEQADGGTIFLDEIGEISLTTQVKLLRVLQEKEFFRVGGSKPISVNVRIISATNRELEQAINEGKFRKDLYYRLNVVPIRIPPLRNHKKDIEKLISYLINKFNQEYGRNVLSISKEALSMILKYDWPGNVRELENYIGRTIINMKFNEKVIEDLHLPAIGSARGKKAPILYEDDSILENNNLAKLLEMTERRHIHKVLEKNNYNRENTAKELGISVRSLYYKLGKIIKV